MISFITRKPSTSLWISFVVLVVLDVVGLFDDDGDNEVYCVVAGTHH